MRCCFSGQTLKFIDVASRSPPAWSNCRHALCRLRMVLASRARVRAQARVRAHARAWARVRAALSQALREVERARREVTRGIERKRNGVNSPGAVANSSRRVK